MPSYRNGYVPADLLVVFNQGWNAQDGNWTHSYPPATYARHLALIARGKARTGRTLRLNYGWTAYRPYAAQVILKRVYGNGAATPGTSSHGGFWEGRQTMAGDYSNWAEVYAGFGGRAAFAEDCRAVGLLPNMIVPARGYPDEPWHVIDPNPWSAVPAFTNAVPFESEEDDMYSDTDRARDVETRAIVESVKGALYRANGSGGWWDMIAAIQGDTNAIRPLVVDVQNRVRGADPRGDMLQLLMAQVGGPAVADVDEAALARELSPLLPSLIGSLSDADVKRIADACADVLAKRLTE